MTGETRETEHASRKVDEVHPSCQGCEKAGVLQLFLEMVWPHKLWCLGYNLTSENRYLPS